MCVSGFSGSGKSFLLQLIAGLYDSYQGAIAFNNIPISSLKKEDVRTYINDCLAKEDIFKGTLYENITLGKENISNNQVQEIVDVLGLTAFVTNSVNGYNTELLPEGKNLPNSIRVKIILARSLVGNPKLVLIGDKINLIEKSDRKKILDYLLKDKTVTVILISNNPEIAEQFDKVIVLDSGKIIGDGKLSQLEKNTWFNQIFQKQ